MDDGKECGQEGEFSSGGILCRCYRERNDLEHFIYAVFCCLTLGIVIAADLYRYFRLRGGCLAEHLGSRRTAVRWVIYYAMLALIFAAFLMQNGNYVGSVSFAYGGF